MISATSRGNRGWFRRTAAWCGRLISAALATSVGPGAHARKVEDSRGLTLECLEPRWALSGGGIVAVGSQPAGGLSGKVVYTHAGHGFTANNLNGGAWSAQRPELFEMIEDFGNQDQMTFFADYLFRAGATVVPLRPVGHQPREVVLDNDDPGVTFSGSWTASVASIYFGSAGDVPYRFATTATVETAVARYRPSIAKAGFYPVYAWTRAGSDRASDQLYRIHHTGGATEVTVNHRRVGTGLVYLGTYYFAQGTEGHVEISNRSSEPGRVVIADMIRLGNGTGDIDRGGGISGLAREDEAGLYWVQWHVDRSQGISSSVYRASSDDRTATVSLAPRYASYMNRSADGQLSDRVFVSYHSNAGGGAARGVLGLYNGNNTPSSATPNQFQLANLLAREINDDLVAQNGRYEHPWANRTTVTLDRSDIEFGEINNTYIQNQFDATILETGFHDNQQDAEMLRDPRVRDAMARATYQGLVRYFRSLDGTTPLTMAPARVPALSAQSMGAGTITVSWNLPPINGQDGDAPTGYRIYASRDGYGFDGGTLVAGGSTSSYTFSQLEEAPYYFQVAAVNAGGEAPASEVVAAMPSASQPHLLIVNGFDRLERRLNPRQVYPGGQLDRVRPRQSNSFDYAVQVASAVQASTIPLRIDTTSNERLQGGQISLAPYDAVVWILGEESSADQTFNATEQSQVAAYLAAGGRLFVSGAEIGWDLDQLNNGRDFYRNTLRASYVADDALTYRAAGVTGSILSGINVSFDNGSTYYDVDFPDVLSPQNGATPALQYTGGTGGTAGVVYAAPAPDGQRLVMLGFPFETILSVATRDWIMSQVLDFFELAPPPSGDFNADGVLDCSDTILLTAAIQSGTFDRAFDLNQDQVLNQIDMLYWVTQLRGTLPGDANLDGAVDVTDFNLWNAHKFTAGGSWCTADFNGDGLTDVADFNTWNAHKFRLATLATLATPTSRPQPPLAGGLPPQVVATPGAPRHEASPAPAPAAPGGPQADPLSARRSAGHATSRPWGQPTDPTSLSSALPHWPGSGSQRPQRPLDRLFAERSEARDHQPPAIAGIDNFFALEAASNYHGTHRGDWW